MSSRSVLTLLLTLAVVASGLLPHFEVSAQGGSEMFDDPQGRFSIPVPSGWTVEEHDGFIVVVDPDGDLRFSVVVTEGETARDGIAAGVAVIHPEFGLEPIPGVDQDFPADGDIDETVILTYDIGMTSGHVVQAIGQRVGSENYVVLIEGSLDAVTRRNSQVQLIAAGFVIGAPDDENLSGLVPAAFEGAMVETFEAFALDLLTRAELPGMSVVVVQNGQIVWSDGFGVTSLGGVDRVTADTLMMLGSVSKSFTTTMMASMVDDGLFDWDTPVVAIDPGFQFSDPQLTAEITMRNLVCACTGVPRRDLELLLNAHEMTAEEIIDSLAGFEVFTDFGEAFQYSNQMVAAGGYIAALAGGGIMGDLDDGYTQELQHRVLDPLGMERTTLSFLAASNEPDVAAPHGLMLDGTLHQIPLDSETLLEPVKPAGTLWSTANELGDYLIMQLADGVAADGTIVVSPGNLLETRVPQIEVATTLSYGLGWLVENHKGMEIISHGGNTLGFTSHLAFIPEADLGIAVLINAQAANGIGEALQARLLELVFDLEPEIEAQIGQFFGDQATPTASASPEPQTFGDRPDLAEVEAFLGLYRSPVLGNAALAWSAQDGFTIDVGEFVAELRPVAGPTSEFGNWIMFDGPGVGGSFTLQVNEGGNPEIVANTGSDVYVFTLVDNGDETG